MILRVDARGRIAAFEDQPTGAAHSMDTHWYAVDASGCVASHFSDEEGRVPVDREYDWDWEWKDTIRELILARISSRSPGEPLDERPVLERQLAAATDPTEIALLQAILAGDEASRAIYSDWLEAHGRDRDAWTPRNRTVFVIDREGIRKIEPDALGDDWTGVIRFTNSESLARFREAFWDEGTDLDPAFGMPHAVWFDLVTQDLFDEFWHEHGIASAYRFEEGYEYIDLHKLGLFEYECQYRGPYYRTIVPEAPLRVDDLSENLRAKFAKVRFDKFDFATTESFEPDRFVECRGYRD